VIVRTLPSLFMHLLLLVVLYAIYPTHSKAKPEACCAAKWSLLGSNTPGNIVAVRVICYCIFMVEIERA
jgi:hypothetical protein